MYRYPPPLMARLAWAVLLRRKRSFSADAAALLQAIKPPPFVEGLEHVPATGGLVLVVNHYQSPSYAVWWGAIVLTALVAAHRPASTDEICWVMTEAWTHQNPLLHRLLYPTSRWVFRRLAHVYGLAPFPPMPPRPHEAEARARAVRGVLALARRPNPPPFAIAPEGHDSPDASLMVPPAGVGRFLMHLGGPDRPFVPVGLHEEGQVLVVRCGPPFHLPMPPTGLTRQAADRWAADQVMQAIAQLLPASLQGAYRAVNPGDPPQPPHGS